MKKTISYFLQSIIIFLFFIFGKILGIKMSRKIFAFVFTKIGPIFRSKKIIKKNLNFSCYQVKFYVRYFFLLSIFEYL